MSSTMLAIFIIVTLLSLVAGSFVHPGNCMRSKIRSSNTSWNLAKRESDSDEEINGPNGIKVPRKRKQRCVDYPRYAYSSFRFKARDVSFKVRPEKLADGEEGTSTKRDAASKQSSVKRAKNVFSSGVDVSSSPRISLFESEAVTVARSARVTRLLNERTYAKQELFEASNLNKPPNLKDLSPPRAKKRDTIWISTPARVASFIIPYLIFPYIIKFLDHYVTMEPAQLDEITSKFGPGVSILYGTFVSLTLSILYNRQQEIQDNVAIESALLGVMTRNLLHLFRRDPESAVEAGQCTADQVRTLVRASRGQELMLLMYSDPYARMIELIEYKEEELLNEQGDLGVYGTTIGHCRDIVKDLCKTRASRLSDEALALPPTHFAILSVLTLLILLGYAVTVLPTVDAKVGVPSNESSLLFGCLSSIYVLFYNFTKDLNDPFGGLYQIRRSSTASHLLQIKWLLVNHPLLRGEVDFEPVEEDNSGDVQIRTPGIGDLWFEKEDIYPDGESLESGRKEAFLDDTPI